jgi:hypothetical protein
LERNGLETVNIADTGYSQIDVHRVKKVVLSDLRVIDGWGEGVHLWSCENALLSGKSIIRGNRLTGLWAVETQLTVENAVFEDNGKAIIPNWLSYELAGIDLTPDCWYYQILAERASNVQLKEVLVAQLEEVLNEEQESGGIWVSEQSTVKLEGGIILGHGREAIKVEDMSKMVIIGARILDNACEEGAQVIVKRNARAEIEDTFIKGSPHGGVFVENEGILTLKKCRIFNNKDYDLMAVKGSIVERIETIVRKDRSD